MLAGGHGVGGVGGAAGAIGPDEDAVFLDIAVGDRDGDASQIRGAPDRARAATAGTAAGRGRCGGDPPDGGLDQQRERLAALGNLDGVAGVPDLLDREGVHPRAILHLIAESDLSVQRASPNRTRGRL